MLEWPRLSDMNGRSAPPLSIVVANECLAEYVVKQGISSSAAISLRALLHCPTILLTVLEMLNWSWVCSAYLNRKALGSPS